MRMATEESLPQKGTEGTKIIPLRFVFVLAFLMLDRIIRSNLISLLGDRRDLHPDT